MVDCSHGNSEKKYELQPQVMKSVVDQIEAGNRSISGVMIESYLKEGNQPMPKDLSQLAYGVSITDSCIGWETTEQTLREAHARLKACGGRSGCLRETGRSEPSQEGLEGYLPRVLSEGRQKSYAIA